MLNTSTLRPGLLVSFKTGTSGNVTYIKNVIEAEHTTKDGAEKARWETERTVADAKEHEAAKNARSKIGATVRGVCSWSAFGLLCPEDKSEELEKAIADARQIADDFNSTAKLTRVHVYVMCGKIAADDVEAVKAINSEIRDLMDSMADGMKNLDVKTVRDAANRARGLGQMLTVESQTRVQMAIDTARKAAREIVKAGEIATVEVDKTAIRKVNELRATFLDLDEAKPIAKPKKAGRAIDLDPAIAKVSADYIRKAKKEKRQLEM